MANPTEWKTYEELAHGIDRNRLPQSGALAGTTVGIDSQDGVRWSLDFSDDGRVRWAQLAGEGAGDGGDEPADVVEVDDDVFFVDVWLRSRGDRDALTAIVDRRSGRTLTVLSSVRETAPEGEPRVAQRFSAGTIAGREATGPVPAPTRDLIGKRLFNDYSPDHLYEHVYVNSGRYCWQCLAGVQKGHGDCDLASYWKFDEDRYLFTFREFRIPVASAFFFNLDTMRSTGKFLGIEGDGGAGEINNSGAGAHIQWLSETHYPDGVEPV